MNLKNRMEPFGSAIFFDNDVGHIQAVSKCPGIACVKVGAYEDIEHKPLPNDFPDADFYRLLSDEGKVAHYALIHSGLWKRQQYDPDSGINIDHLRIAAEWITEVIENKIKNPVVLIDFDRTLSQFEGVESSLLTMPRVTIEGYANWLLGGTSRVEQLKDFLDTVAECGIKVIILTNNGLCSQPNNTLIQIVETLYGKHFNEAEFICSRPVSPKATAADWSNSKLNTLKKDPRFASLCKNSNGGKRNTKKLTRRQRRSLKTKRALQ